MRLTLRSATATTCVLALTSIGALVVSLPAHAAPSTATIIVTTTDPSGPGSLAQAVLDANADPGADVIGFADGVTGDIVISSPLELSTATTIEGPGADALRLVLEPASSDPMILVGSTDPDQRPDVTLRGLTVVGGQLMNDLSNDPENTQLSVGTLTVDQVSLAEAGLNLGYTIGSLAVTGSHLDNAYLRVNNISGDLTLTGSRLDGATIVDCYVIGGDVILDKITSTGEVDSSGAMNLNEIAGALTLTDSSFSGTYTGFYINEVMGPVTISDVEMTDDEATYYTGFSISDPLGGLEVTRVTIGGRSYPIRVNAHTDEADLIDVTLTDLTLTSSSVYGQTGVYAFGHGIGNLTINRLTASGYMNALQTQDVQNLTRITDSVLTGPTDEDAYPSTAMSIYGSRGDVTVEDSTISGFRSALETNVWEPQEDRNMLVTVQRSTLTDMTDSAVQVVYGDQDVVLDQVHVARTSGALRFNPLNSGDRTSTATITSSTFDDVIGDTYTAPVEVNGGHLVVSSSTFDQQGLSEENINEVAHFIAVSGATPQQDGPRVLVESSTFEGAGVFTTFDLTPEDTVQLSHVIGDSVDEAGAVAEGHADVDGEWGGSLVVDHSLFTAEQAAMTPAEDAEGTATWGEGNLFGVTAAQKNLGPLQQLDGQPTPTRLLLAGSVAIDAGDPSLGVSRAALVDQRGLPRVYRTVDIGAVEMSYGFLTLTPTVRVDGGTTAALVVSRVDGPDSAFGDVSTTLTLTPGTAESGTDFTGPSTFAVSLPAGTESATVEVPTVAVADRGERTLTGTLSLDASRTPLAAAHTSAMTIVQQDTVPPTVPPTTEPVDPSVPPAPTDPAAPTGSPSASTDAGTGAGTGELPATGAQVAVAVVAALVLLAAGAALVVARRRRG